MAIQTSVSAVMPAGFPGLWYDISDTDAVGRTVEGSAMPFGVAAVQGTHNNQCRLPDHGDALKLGATSDDDNAFVGIIMAHSVLASANVYALPVARPGGVLQKTETASCARHGRIWVLSETDADQYDPVFYRHTLEDATASPQTQQLGGIRNDADTDKATQISSARYLYSAKAGQLAVIELTGAK